MTEPPMQWFRLKESRGKAHLVELKGKWFSSICGFPLARKPELLVPDNAAPCRKCAREFRFRIWRAKRESQTN